MRIVLLFFICGTFFLKSEGQPNVISFSKELRFFRYLLDHEMYKEAWFQINQLDESILSPQQRDTLNFEKGWLLYSKKSLDSSSFFFEKVSKNDARYNKAFFFSAYNAAYMHNLKKTDSCFQLLKLTVKDSLELELLNFQMAGLALLRNDYTSFQKFKMQFLYHNPYTKREEEKMSLYANKYFNAKKKSPIIAATLSAIIPGSGKWYAGKKKQGIAAFLPVVSSLILTIEAYNKKGINDARFWIYGSFFTTFYIGNIWGSYLSVKIKKNQDAQLFQNRVLFDMHIPLRNFYN